MELIRLNKAIAQTGYCSRREADKLIEKGLVKINGRAVVLGDKVNANDEISIKGKTITKQEKKVYLIFNKPIGITCTTDQRVKDNIISFINFPLRIYPIGRLDKPSEGLIFLTNDGDIVNKILRARNHHEKEYLVRVDKPITKEFVRKMSAGVPILDTITRKCTVEKIDNYTFTIVLTQGLNRQIRRMCEFLEYNVLSLKRLRIMNVKLGNLKSGTYRNFTSEEFKTLNNLLKHSKKTID